MALVVAAVGAASCNRKPDRVVLGIGMTDNARAALTLAEREVNASGGVGGVPLKLQWGGDDSYDPKLIIKAADQFVEARDLVAVIGHSDSASTLTAAASYNRGGVPQIVTIATNPAITNIGVWTYRLCLSDAAQGPALAEYAVNDWKKRRIAIFYVNDDYGRALAERFERRAGELGGIIVSATMHRNVLQSDDQEAIRIALADMKRGAQPDLVVLFQRVPAALWTLKAIREAGIEVDKLGCENLAQFYFIEGGPELTEGVRVSQFLDVDPADPRAVKFAADFRAITATDPDYSQAFAYDAVYLLRGAALEGRYTRAGVKAYLDRLIRDRTPVRGVAGTFTLGADHDARRPLYIAEIHAGRFRTIKPLEVR
jgi:branched-chain amino acid transport system substrate-binding protein